VTTAPQLFASESWRQGGQQRQDLDNLDQAILSTDEKMRQGVLDFYRSRMENAPWNSEYIADEVWR
jgi:hypothetical protein